MPRPKLPSPAQGGWHEYRRRMAEWARRNSRYPYDWSRDDR